MSALRDAVEGLCFVSPSQEQLPLLLELVGEFYAYEQLAFDEAAAHRALLQLIEQPVVGRVWLIRWRGCDVGYLALTFGWSIEYGGRDAFLDELFLREAHRGKGFGRAALEFASRQCIFHGAGALHLEVERKNLQAQRFYHSQGFREGDRRLLTRRLEPLPILALPPLLLRPLEASDLKPLQQLLLDPSLRECLLPGQSTEIDVAHEIRESQKRFLLKNYGLWAVIHQTEMIGFAGFRPYEDLDLQLVSGFLPEYTHDAARAIRALCAYGFRELRWPRIQASTPAYPHSICALEMAGLEQINEAPLQTTKQEIVFFEIESPASLTKGAA